MKTNMVAAVTVLCLSGYYLVNSSIFLNIHSVISAGYDFVQCSSITVCCNEWEIIKNFTGLDHDLDFKFADQHLIRRAIARHTKGHWMSDNPPKALVLSYHGPTTIGNEISQIIASNMYKKGLESPFVHIFPVTQDFLDEGVLSLQKDELRFFIENNIRKCEESLFIFEGVDRFPATLLDTIKPYAEYYEHLAGVNYRKSVFLFLSNSGGEVIEKTLQKHLASGERRELLKLVDIENALMTLTLNKDDKGLWRSHLVVDQLVTAYIPFVRPETEVFTTGHMAR